MARRKPPARPSLEPGYWKPEPRPRRRKAAAALDPLTAAKRAVAEADEQRAAEHTARYVLPKRVESVSYIERMFVRGSLDTQQRDAANRLLEDHRAAGLDPTVTANLTGSGVGAPMGGNLPTGPKLADYVQALRAVGPGLSLLLVAVVIEDWSPQDWARRHDMSEYDGIAGLRLALNELCYHYGTKRRPK